VVPSPTPDTIPSAYKNGTANGIEVVMEDAIEVESVDEAARKGDTASSVVTSLRSSHAPIQLRFQVWWRHMGLKHPS
jgi:hypothetical protein